MKPKRDSDRHAVGNANRQSATLSTAMPFSKLTAQDWFGLFFGGFLGLAFLKFGNPVVLESKIFSPASLSEFWSYAWPPGWTHGMLIVLAVVGSGLTLRVKTHWPASRWLWIAPVVWFTWQCISATRTVDGDLTATTLWQFAGCLTAYLLGAMVIGNDRSLRWLLVGLLIGFAICLVKAVDQKLFEFPREKQFLIDNEKSGWTNLPPEMFLDLQQHGVVVTTNGMQMANPSILHKYEKARVFGTLVYPNALAGAVLLLLPLSLMLAIFSTRRFRMLTRWFVIALTIFLGAGALFWTGSKSGWLIAIGMSGVWLLRLPSAARIKWVMFALIFVIGLTVFGVRFRSYFAAGATSIGARFDYWRAAGQTTYQNPILGTGPGTFQHPYERIKAPEAEMARLTHNDYLEQFSDSGVLGGLSYTIWIALLIVTLARHIGRPNAPFYFAVFLGLCGWFVQGISEFSLYVPALAWTAFTLGGCLLGLTGNQFDKSTSAD